MVNSAGNRLPIGILCLVIAAQSGCANGPLSDFTALNPFLRESDADGRYGPTPAQQVAAIRDAGHDARRMDAAQQARIAEDLAQRLANERDPLLREELIAALAPLQTPAAADALRRAVQDKDVHVRMRAVQAWSERPVAEAVPVLAQTLASDTDFDIRLAATKALGKFRDPSVVRPLSIALEDPDPALQHRAVAALRNISGRDFGTDLAAWRQFARGDVIEMQQEESLARSWLGRWF
jgi:HEAT repeat protein